MGTDQRAPKTSGRANPQRTRQAAVETLDEQNRRYIEAVLASCNGRVDGPFGAMRRLGINPNTLRGRMRKLGIDPRRYRIAVRS